MVPSTPRSRAVSLGAAFRWPRLEASPGKDWVTVQVWAAWSWLSVLSSPVLQNWTNPRTCIQKIPNYGMEVAEDGNSSGFLPITPTPTTISPKRFFSSFSPCTTSWFWKGSRTADLRVKHNTWTAQVEKRENAINTRLQPTEMREVCSRQAFSSSPGRCRAIRAPK